MSRKNKGKFNKHNQCSLWSNWYSQYNYLEHNPREFENTASASFEHGSFYPKEERDKKGRRIISRKSLYEDPYFFYNNDTYLKQCGIEWDPQKWQRARDDNIPQGYNKINLKKKKVKQNQVEKKINKMLAQPVEMSKAERMMEKMGWQGGALGKNGEGITEPIVPNASYATKTLGLGQTIATTKHEDFKENKVYFDTNVLLNVLEFVKNETEIETTFERHLSREERKCVHTLVGGLENIANPVEHDYTFKQMDIVQEINVYNQYILGTESEGYGRKRFLCLYKDAPYHVYLLTPDDLHQQENDNSNSEIDKEMKGNEETVTPRDSNAESTPNITGNEEVTVEMLLNRIINYFFEFVADDNYTEFRFLGPFTHQDMDAIDLFVGNIRINVYGDDEQLKEAYQKIEIKKNVNGYTMLRKLKKDSQALVENKAVKN